MEKTNKTQVINNFDNQMDDAKFAWKVEIVKDNENNTNEEG